MRPRHPKPDANQAAIVGQLRDLGFIVHDVSSLGGDVLDLFVANYDVEERYRWLQVEVKMPGEKLTDDEQAYFDKLKEYAYGAYAELAIIAYSIEDILKWFGYGGR